MATRNVGAISALGILLTVNLLNFFDRQILGAVGELIRREWQLGDTALGGLGTAFILLYAVIGVPLGSASDRYRRTHLLAAGVAVWSLMTALSAGARNFVDLFVLRLGVGVGEAICAPAATSLIGDLFPPHQRGRALSVFMLGLPLGLGLSFLVSSLVAQQYGWRAAFLVAGLPGLLIAGLTLLIREPLRGASEGTAGIPAEPGYGFGSILRIPTMTWIILSGILQNFNMYALGTFISPFFIRYHELSLKDAGWAGTLVYGFSGAPALLLGGFLADRCSRNRVQGRLWLGAASLAVTVPAFWFGLESAPGKVAVAAGLLAAGCGLSYLYYSAVYPSIQEVIPPQRRASAMALYFLGMYLLGGALGPFATGALSDWCTRKAAERQGVVVSATMNKSELEPFRGEGLRQAMRVVPVLNGALVLVLAAAAWTLPRDAARMRRAMERSRAAADAGPQTS